MRNLTLISTILLFSILARADVFESYQAAGNTALELTQSEPVKTDVIVEQIKTMIGYGYEIMDLYLAKYPECQAQFAQLKEASTNIDQLSYDEIDRLYHSGEGLVTAPRLCYKGRSLVIHPYQVIALIKEARLVKDADIVDHEMNEVIERSEAIKDLLKN